MPGGVASRLLFNGKIYRPRLDPGAKKEAGHNLAAVPGCHPTAPVYLPVLAGVTFSLLASTRLKDDAGELPGNSAIEYFQ